MGIERLTEALTQKIAAGEVVERPASVVKELIENAIDAKSERIDVELSQGGRATILVRDDGSGMERADLPLSTERYTTSKIRSEADLQAIATLGFRGEALASIAAVSRLRIISRVRGGTDAHCLRVAGGTIEGISPDARAPGTTVEVSDLFFNLPARARFLGSPRTEFLHVNRVAQRFALLASEIGWTLTHNDREVFAAPPAGSLHDRLGQIYGTKVAHALIPVQGRRGEIEVSGFISRPDLKRGSRRDQLFIVNGRAIADRGLAYVLASAYRGILRPGSYPLVVLRIDLPPSGVDVNVHPRKEEVRFATPRQVQDALAAAVHHALSTPHVVAPLGVQSGERKVSGVFATDPHESRTRALPFDLGDGVFTAQRERDLEKVRVRGDRRVIGQLQFTYLLVETPDGLDVVDQHIAHERILYERLCKDFHASTVVRQLFLLPVRIELPFEAAEIVSAHQDQLEHIGIVLEEFGGGTFLLREYPRMLAEEQSRRGFQEVVETLAQVLSVGGDVETTLFDRLLSELACAAAVKANERLPLTEAQTLVERLMRLDNPYTCPHGRPIVFTLSREDLDRRFGRR
jgi:DNA mismatch repair protein MutL